ncbi:MAG: rhodanese-related sulfurtransferase [Crocinitomicaceae bacterium]|jgi:rhodanese-related sulfurtransferase
MPLTKDELLNEARQSLNIIDAKQVEHVIAAGTVILDVREPAEFDMGHLHNAVNIPRGLLEFMVGNNPALKDFNQSIVVYCKNGGRSTLASDTLQKMGFKKITMLAGGFDSWTGTIHKVEIADNLYNS